MSAERKMQEKASKKNVGEYNSIMHDNSVCIIHSRPRELNFGFVVFMLLLLMCMATPFNVPDWFVSLRCKITLID